ncbi:MAG: NAD(P)/FAD-dependent oxidoreductase [Rhodothermaceae bacterium]|nr:NAD(P)/FAD-dependent oxidoreductase [Rhodothermaceae bacterium]
MKEVDIAIIGGGPAGLQAALVLSRTRKSIVVFDTPSPPRNGASHGVHNVLGLDGLLPAEIREQAWSQINVYKQAELRKEIVTDISHGEDGLFILSADSGIQLKAKRVILALGYVDQYPDLDGFVEAWADTIIPCPFCDGYENRDRTWGLVARSEMHAVHFVDLVNHWTHSAKLILNDPDLKLDAADEKKIVEFGIPIYSGPITAIDQRDGKMQAVTLQNGERVEVETLWWAPERKKTSLEKRMIESFQLELDDTGLIKTDEEGQTPVHGLYAVGDVAQMMPSALGAMVGGNSAAFSIVRQWYA